MRRGLLILVCIATLSLTACRTYQFNNKPTEETKKQDVAADNMQESVAADIEETSSVTENVVIEVKTEYQTQLRTEAQEVTTQKETQVQTQKETESTQPVTEKETVAAGLGTTEYVVDDSVKYILEGFNASRVQAQLKEVVLSERLGANAQAQANKMAQADYAMPDIYSGYYIYTGQSTSMKENMAKLAGSYCIENSLNFSDSAITEIGIAYAKSESGMYYVCILAKK